MTTINLARVASKTRLSDVLIILNSIEQCSQSFNRVSQRHSFVAGCLDACGFSYSCVSAPLFSRYHRLSADRTIFRLPISCSCGRWNYRTCFEIDVSRFKGAVPLPK